MNPQEPPEFTFPRNLERYLATLSHHYAKRNEPLLQRVIVNSRVKVDEGAEFDNWDGGIWGHGLCMKVPFEIFLEVIEQKNEVEARIKDDLARIMTDVGEYVAGIDLEQYEEERIEGWREKSGALTLDSKIEAEIEDPTRHIWEDGFLRLFLSHKSDQNGLPPIFRTRS